MKPDFIGVNLTKDGTAAIVRKHYLSPVTDRFKLPPLSQRIADIGAFSYFTPILRDNGDIDADMRLCQRHNENMEQVFAYLRDIVPFFASNETSVRMMAQLPISRDPHYQYAALYYLCIMQRGGSPVQLKFHFLTRYSKDTDEIADAVYDNPVFLKALQDMEIPQLSLCCRLATPFLSKTDALLWMAGMDCGAALDSYKVASQNNGSKGIHKYKVYIKWNRAPEGMQQLLSDTLRLHSQSELAAAAEAFSDVTAHHEEKLYGLGFCCDDAGTVSLNYYLKPRG